MRCFKCMNRKRYVVDAYIDGVRSIMMYHVCILHLGCTLNYTYSPQQGSVAELQVFKYHNIAYLIVGQYILLNEQTLNLYRNVLL
jgi:hypothetical protein